MDLKDTPLSLALAGFLECTFGSGKYVCSGLNKISLPNSIQVFELIDLKNTDKTVKELMIFSEIDECLFCSFKDKVYEVIAIFESGIALSNDGKPYKIRNLRFDNNY